MLCGVWMDTSFHGFAVKSIEFLLLFPYLKCSIIIIIQHTTTTIQHKICKIYYSCCKNHSFNIQYKERNSDLGTASLSLVAFVTSQIGHIFYDILLASWQTTRSV